MRQGTARIAARAGAAAGTIWSIPLLLVYILPSIDWAGLEAELISYFVNHALDQLTAEAVSYMVTIAGFASVILAFTTLGTALGIIYFRSYNRLPGKNSVSKGVALGGLLWILAAIAVFVSAMQRGLVLLEVIRDGVMSLLLTAVLGLLLGIFYYEFTHESEGEVEQATSSGEVPVQPEAAENK